MKQQQPVPTKSVWIDRAAIASPFLGVLTLLTAPFGLYHFIVPYIISLCLGLQSVKHKKVALVGLAIPFIPLALNLLAMPFYALILR